jgi:truncated hemoglobin YjbI
LQSGDDVLSEWGYKQAEFFAAALGGFEPYTGAPMEQVHRGRGITMTTSAW